MTSSENGHARVDVSWIAAHLGDPNVRLVEVDVSRAAYDTGHIPGATVWNAYSDLRDENYRPVDRSKLERLLSRSGIRPDTTVAVYGYAAPLGFWLLKAIGHRDARILLGARDQWQRGGYEWTTDPARVTEAAHGPVTENADVLATRDQVEAAIGDPMQLLLDVRSEGEYVGERFWPSGTTEDTGRSGHIPGAINVPIGLLRGEGENLKPPSELRGTFEAAGIGPAQRIITYCTIGNRASEAWLALKHLLGYPHVRVYYGSWVEWGKEGDTAIEV